MRQPNHKYLPPPPAWQLLTYGQQSNAPITVAEPVCKKVADFAADAMVKTYAYFGKADEKAALAKEAYKHAIESYNQAVRAVSQADNSIALRQRALFMDYIYGAALALDPLPSLSKPGFITTDAEALHSDWVNAKSDIEQVSILTLRTLDRAFGAGKRPKRKSTSGETGQSVDSVGGHSSGT